MTQRFSTKKSVTSEHYLARGNDDGTIDIAKTHGPHDEASGRGGRISRKEATALAAVFEDQKDINLGRWRSELKPWMVVYPVEGGSQTNEMIRVLSEKSGVVQDYQRKDRVLQQGFEGDFEYTARAYFNAHKLVGPWTTPGHNEIWELRLQDGTAGAFIANCEHASGKPVFANADTYMFAESDSIRHGVRIYPKATS